MPRDFALMGRVPDGLAGEQRTGAERRRGQPLSWSVRALELGEPQRRSGRDRRGGA